MHGVLRLGHAFTRAISVAAPPAAAWQTLPLGQVGTIRLELAVDDAQRLGDTRRLPAPPDEPAPPTVLEEWVEQALHVLRGARVALSNSNQPGIERLVVNVTLDLRPVEPGDTQAAVTSRFSGGSPARPGHASLRYGTGRVVEVSVTIVEPER